MLANRISVVDSDEAYLRFVDRFLSAEGCVVFSHSVGRDALLALVEEKPDLIVFDTWIEDREAGWALLEGLSLEPQLRDVPVILTCSDPQLVKTRHHLLANHSSLRVLPKPFSPDALLMHVRATGKASEPRAELKIGQ